MVLRSRWWAAIGVLAGCRGPVSPPVMAIDTTPGADFGVVRLSGLSRGARAALVDGGRGVRLTATLPGDSGTAQSLAGKWTLAGDTAVFRPRFIPTGGLVLRVEVSAATLGAAGGGLTRQVVLPEVAVSGSAPRLLAIHPEGDSLPENTLRLYLQFATPMRPGEALRRLRLEGGGGREVERAFLDVSQELWDRSGRRLTVLFDPGRVKQGIRTNLESGRPLRAGRRYRLVVDGGWPDLAGRSLGATTIKAFVATVADQEGPDPSRWSIEQPAIGSLDAVVVRFEGAVDQVLAERLIVVADETGNPLPGRASALAAGRGWRFVPEGRWLAGRYQLLVSPELEDPAGNRPGRAFDRELRAGSAAGEKDDVVLTRWFTSEARGDRPTAGAATWRSQPASAPVVRSRLAS